MSFILITIAAIAIMALIVFFALQILKTVINLSALSNKENLCDISKQREGMVYNTETGKLEADQSLILPLD